MKKFFAGLSLFVGVSLLSCEETGSNDQISVSTISHYRTIGAPIPFATGMHWIDLYNERNPSSARTQLLDHFELSESMTLELMNSVSDLVGIAFHYGNDVFGQKHIIAIPVDNTMKLWTDIPGRIYVDTNSGSVISQSTASTWAQNYKNQNPSSIWFHFFGEDVFLEITALPFFNSIDIQPALNELLAPQLLLVIWNESLSLGRSQSEEEGAIYDASNPCPHCAVD